MDAKSNDVATNELGSLVRDLVQALTTSPEDVLVLARRQDQCVLVQVSAPKEQLGRLIGKHGETARALRRITQAVGTKHAVRCELSIGPFASPMREVSD